MWLRTGLLVQAARSECVPLGLPVGPSLRLSPGLGSDGAEAQHGWVDVELLVVPECPNEGAAATLVRRALDDVGLRRLPIRTRVVSTDEEAEQLLFVGSPTVRIDGEDPFPTAGMPVGLACRVYLSEGVRSGLPDLRQLRQALKRRADAHPRG